MAKAKAGHPKRAAARKQVLGRAGALSSRRKALAAQSPRAIVRSTEVKASEATISGGGAGGSYN